MSGGDASQIQIGEKTRKNKPGRVHCNKLETGLTEEGKSSDYLKTQKRTSSQSPPLHHVAFSICQVLAQPGSRTQTNLDLVKDHDKGGSNKVKILQGEILEESPGLQMGIPSHSSSPTSLGGHTWTAWLCSSEGLWFLPQ